MVLEKERKLCRRFGHDWVFYAAKKEQCTSCKMVILDRALRAHRARVRACKMYSPNFNLVQLEKALYPFFRNAPQRIPVYHRWDLGEIANVIYYLRYDRGWTARQIEQLCKCRIGTMNAIICKHPWFPICPQVNPKEV